jgi:hypothetical protein
LGNIDYYQVAIGVAMKTKAIRSFLFFISIKTVVDVYGRENEFCFVHEYLILGGERR